MNPTPSRAPSLSHAQLLSQAELKAIESAVQQAEVESGAEIVVRVAPKAASYAAWRLLGGVLIGMLLGFAFAERWHHLHPAWSLTVCMGGMALGWWFLCPGPALMTLVPDLVECRAVERAAKLAMVDLGVIDTARRSGVLIFVSELERRVHILADSGIAMRVDVARWQPIVEHLTQAIRAGKAADGLKQAVQDIAELVLEAFPHLAQAARNSNELSDSVRLDAER